MPEINETSPVEGEADRKGDVEYIAYIGPPEFPLLVDRDKEVLALPEKMKGQGEECRTETTNKSISANRRRTSLF